MCVYGEKYQWIWLYPCEFYVTQRKCIVKIGTKGYTYMCYNNSFKRIRVYIDTLDNNEICICSIII